MGIRRAIVCGAAAVLASAGAAAPCAQAARAARLGEPYGVVASNANFVPGKTVEERAAAYRRLRDAGVRAIRLDINWAQIEPAGAPLHDYDFGDRDREIAAIRAAGLKVIGLLGYGHPDYSRLGALVAPTPAAGGVPPFGVGNAQFFPPDDVHEFARWARAVADHFGDEVVAWEVWNEENGGWRFWAPHEDPAAYGRLLCAAHDALKAADPRTPVVFGGMFFPEVAQLPGQGAVRFLDGAYRADPRIGRCFDAVGYHPYAYPFTAPELDLPVRGSVISARDQLQAVLDAHGAHATPLWITEVGWPTHDRTYGISEAKQAQYVARMLAVSFAQGIPVVTWYTYGDYADATGANQEAWFGFFRPDGTPKPAYAALRTFTTVLHGARFDADESKALGMPGGGLFTGGRGFALRFARGRARITVAWVATESALDAQGALPPDGTLGARPVAVRVPVSGASARVVDLLGASRTVAARDGAVDVVAGPSPVYVVDRGPARHP